MCKKNHTSNQKPCLQWCIIVSHQVSSLLRVLAVPNCFVCFFTVIQSENLLSEQCSRSWNRIAWNYFMVRTNEKKIAESLQKQSRKGKNISLSCTFDRSHTAYFVFCLQMNNTNLNSKEKG